MMKFSPSTGGFYDPSIHSDIPEDAVSITDERWRELLTLQSSGLAIVPGPEGAPVALDPSRTLCALLGRIDAAADAARVAVAGDPLRAVEYERTRADAEAYRAAGYQGEVPPTVAAWAINGRTPQQAADDILRAAALYTAAIVQLRALRLAAKEQVRAFMAAGQVEQAQQVADQAIADIQAAVAGIGNATS